MPTFPKPTPAALTEFAIQLSVDELAPAAPIVRLSFSAVLLDGSSTRLHSTGGDLTQFLTAGQIAALNAIALAQYAKAKVELLA